ncbi:MAG: protein kinase [Pyrinomonadaceae bacterium]
MSIGLEADTNLSHYRIVSKIGAGGMGEVYLAEDTKLDRKVALKVLSADVAADEDRVHRFVREAKAASALNHQNILTIFEIGTFDGSHYIATELINGKTLRDHMRGGDLSLTEAIGIALQSAAALGAAHEAGIIHRDIKPENIMIRDDRLVKVLDFGLAKLTEKYAEVASPEDATKAQLNTQPGLVMGTVAYMSPEQARGHELDARSDIFSLGIVMYELFGGKRPFEGEGNVDLISSIIKDEPLGLRQIAPQIPRQLERIVDKSLRKDRDHRYQHVKDLEIDLADLLEELRFETKLNKTVDQGLAPHITEADGAGSTANASTFTQSISTTRRFTLLHAMIFGVVAVALIGSVWYFAGMRGRTIVPGDLKTSEVASWSSAAGELFSNASFSPDGKLIAFSSTRSGSKNIWVSQTGSTEAIQVTNDSNVNKDPIFSPKGDEVAFYSEKGSAGDSSASGVGIWRVSALGGTPRLIGSVADGSFELRRWTEGGSIYYQLNGDLYAASISNGASQKVTAFDQQSGRVTWANISPDEKSVASAVQKDGRWRISVGDERGQNDSEIASGEGQIGNVSWLPEKGWFFYSAMTDGIYQVYLAGNSSVPYRITASESDMGPVDVSADGKSIIVSSAKEESTIWRASVGEKQDAPIARGINSDLWPAVSPDGTRVVYQSVKNLSQGNRLLDSTIQVKPISSREEQPVQIADTGFLPTWAPDGSAIALLRRNPEKGGAMELVTANPSGGAVRVLTTGGISAIGYSVSPYNNTQTNAFAWSPDSSQIAYISDRSGASNLWLTSPKSGAERQITQNLETGVLVRCPVWSADGKRLAYSTQSKAEGGSKSATSFFVLDLATTTAASVQETDKIARLIGWTPDENGLIIAQSEKQSGLPPETILKRVAMDSGEEAVIARLNQAYFYNIFLSKDRTFAAYAARVDNMDNIWIVPASGGDPRRVTDNNDSELYFSRLNWLRDGSGVVFGKQTRFSLLSIISGIK